MRATGQPTRLGVRPKRKHGDVNAGAKLSQCGALQFEKRTNGRDGPANYKEKRWKASCSPQGEWGRPPGMMPLRTIVAHIDFSGLSSDVLSAGVMLARESGARLLAAAVIPLPGTYIPDYVLPDAGPPTLGVDYSQAAQDLEELIRQVPHEGVTVEAHTTSGDTAGCLLALLERVHASVMLCACSSTRPVLLRMNRQQERAYRRSPCPILSINSASVSAALRATQGLNRVPRIVVATALEPASEPAVLLAILLARHYAAELTVLHVTHSEHEVPAGRLDFWEFLAGFTAASQRLLSNHVCPEWLSPAPVTMLRKGTPDEQILECVAHMGADLLIIGARRPPLGVPLWPSLASRLAAASPCPLLIVGPNALANVFTGEASRPAAYAAAG